MPSAYSKHFILCIHFWLYLDVYRYKHTYLQPTKRSLSYTHTHSERESEGKKEMGGGQSMICETVDENLQDGF